MTTKSSLNCGAAHRFTLHAVSRIELTVLLCLHLSSHPTGSSCLSFSFLQSLSLNVFSLLLLSFYLPFVKFFPSENLCESSRPFLLSPTPSFLHKTQKEPPPFSLNAMSDGLPPCSLEPSSRNKSWATEPFHSSHDGNIGCFLQVLTSFCAKDALIGTDRTDM